MGQIGREIEVVKVPEPDWESIPEREKPAPEPERQPERTPEKEPEKVPA